MTYQHPETRKELSKQDSAWNRLKCEYTKSVIVKEFEKGIIDTQIAIDNFLPLEKVQQTIRVYIKSKLKPTAVPSVQTG